VKTKRKNHWREKGERPKKEGKEEGRWFRILPARRKNTPPEKSRAGGCPALEKTQA